ncbi:MAG: helix-turn-helix domain-containing protein [Alphaproteobacteria bacterium]
MKYEEFTTKQGLIETVNNRLDTMHELSGLNTYAEFTELCDEAKRRLVHKSLEENKYSFHLAARESGYSNGGMYGLFKTLFSAHDVASKADIIKDYFEDYKSPDYSEDQEALLSLLAHAQNRKELESTITSAEKAFFLSTLKHCDYNNTTAAEILGVGRKMIARKRQLHDITQPKAPTPPPAPKLSDTDLYELSHKLQNECSYNDLNKIYDEVRKHHLADALNESGFNIGQAANALICGRSTLKENFERRFDIPKFDVDTADNAIQSWQENGQLQSPALDLFLKKAPTPQTAHALYKATHKLIITQTFNESGSNQTKAAQELGIDRMTLKHHLKRYDLLNNDNTEQHVKTDSPPVQEQQTQEIIENQRNPIEIPIKAKPHAQEALAAIAIQETLPPTEDKPIIEQRDVKPIEVETVEEPKQYNMEEVAKAFSEHMSFNTVSKLQSDMTRSLLKRTLEKTECNFKQAADLLGMHQPTFENGCRNYLKGVNDGDISSLQKRQRTLTPDHQSVINDILPALETYNDLAKLFDSAKKTIVEKTLIEQGKNMTKTANTLAVPERMLEKMMQKYDIPKPTTMDIQ